MDEKAPVNPKTLQYFTRVAETGSFSAVAREFAVGQPLISKAVQSLEGELGNKLFNRSTRGLSLTEEGERAYQQSLRLLEDYEQLLASQGHGDTAKGLVRLSVPMTLGMLRIIPALEDLLRQHPGLLIDLKMSDAFSDLISERIDVAVRVGDIKDNRLVVKPVGTIKRVLVAGNAYLKKHGTPRKPADLKHHSCIVSGQGESRRQWSFLQRGKKITVGVSGKIAVDGMFGLQQAVLANLGIAMAGELLFTEARLRQRVTPLLSDYQIQSLPLNILFTQNQYIPQRVRVVIDFLAALLASDNA